MPNNPEQVGERCDEADDGKHDSDTGQSIGGAAANMTDKEAVRYIVEDIYQLCNGHGNRHAHHAAGDTALTEVLLILQSQPPFNRTQEQKR